MNFIKHLRERLNCSQTELALRCGIPKQRISEYETGRATPSEKTLLRIAESTGTTDEVLRKCDLLPKKIRRRLRARQQMVLVEQSIMSWLTAMQKFPAVFVQFQAEKMPPERFLRLVRCDSVLEALAWCILIAAGFTPYFASPPAKGFRKKSLVDSHGQNLANLVVPCLYRRCKHGELLVWPQLNIDTRTHIFRVDALVLLSRRGQRHWLVAEIDGKGHDAARDEFRSQQLELPVVRFTEEDISADDFAGKFVKRLLQACTPLQKAA